MNLEIWITYVFATTLILIISGPTIILVINQAVKHGQTSVVPLVVGVVFGNFTAMTLSLLGGTFLSLAWAMHPALFASRLREVIKATRVRKWFNRCGGTALVGAGIFTAGMQRSV